MKRSRIVTVLVAVFVAAVPTAPVIASTTSSGSLSPDTVQAPQVGVGVPASAVGEKPAADGELISLRTATSRTYLHAKGVHEVRVYAEPVNAKASKGSWLPIDTSLVAQGGGFATRNAAVNVALPKDLTAGEVRVGSGADVEGFQLVGAQSGAVAVKGSSATYSAVLPGVDARYDVMASGVKETLVLASSAAPSSYQFTMSLPAGATLVPTANGSLQVTRDGKALFTLPTPSAFDSAPKPETVQGSYAVSGPAQSPTVTVALPGGWLADPARVFPVALDPTSTSSTGGTDTYIESGAQATTNFNGASGSPNCVGYTVRTRPLLGR